jgi:hypothetical protein
MRRSTIGMAGIVTLALVAGLASVPVAAQAPAPSVPVPTIAPTPTPDSGIVWPPMGFEGGDPAHLAWTSACGIWGQSAIALHGEGGSGSADIVVTFDTYDADAFQWVGHVTGSQTGTNGVTVPVDDVALIYYDMDGRWVLVAGPAGQIPAYACAPMSPMPSGAAPG